MTVAAVEGTGARDRFKLLVVGIGGQGVLTAARFLGDAAFSEGLEVVVGQLYGLSQRRGSVRSTVLIGPGLSSFIEPGAADVVLGLEPLEVLRARLEMSARTRVIMNTDLIPSTTPPRNGHRDPDLPQILSDVRAVAPDLFTVDGSRLVEEGGGPQALNIAMLGVLAGLRILPFGSESLWKAIECRSGERFLEANRRAFARGGEVARS